MPSTWISTQVDLYTTLTLWRPLLPYSYSYKASCIKPPFVFLTPGHSDTQGWASECPDVKNYKWRQLNPVWHGMLYSCTHVATVGVEGFQRSLQPMTSHVVESQGRDAVDRAAAAADVTIATVTSSRWCRWVGRVVSRNCRKKIWISWWRTLTSPRNRSRLGTAASW